MTGSLPNLGPSAISSATTYDYWLQQPPQNGQPNQLSWSPFSSTVRLQTVINPATGNSVQIPFNDFSNKLTVNEPVNEALSAARTYSTEVESAVKAEMAGATPQAGSLLGGSLGTNFTAQGQQQGQQPIQPGGSPVSFPDVGPFLPAIDGAQPVAGNRFVLSPETQASLPAPERNEGYSSVPPFGPQLVQSTSTPPALPVPAPTSAMAMVTTPPSAPVTQQQALTSADNLMTAAQGQVQQNSTPAPAMPAMATAPDPYGLLGGINLNEATALNTEAGAGPAGGLNNSNAGIKAACYDAVSKASDTFRQYQDYVKRNENWVKPANGSAAGNTTQTAMAGSAGQIQAGGGANPQVAAQVSQMMQVMAELIKKYAETKGDPNSPELQQIIAMADQFKQMASMGGAVGVQAAQGVSLANGAIANAGGAGGGSDVSGANKAMLTATQGQSFGSNGCVRLVKTALNAAGVNTSGMSDHISSIDQMLSTGEMQVIANKQQLQSGQTQNLKPGDIAYSYGHVGIVGVQNGQLVVVHNSSAAGHTGQAIPVAQWSQLFPDQTAIVRYSPQALAQRSGQAKTA